MSHSRFWILFALAACGTPRPESSAGADTAARLAPPPHPVDSLVLTGPGGIEVWFTAAREARTGDGQSCQERALEVRQDTLRRGVPLLYTREAPTLMGRDAMRAVLYNNCRATAAYRVDFATISPKRLER